MLPCEACIGRLDIRLALFHGSDHALPLLGSTSATGLGTRLFYNLLLLLVIPPELNGIELNYLRAQCNGLIESSVGTTRQVQRRNQR